LSFIALKFTSKIGASKYSCVVDVIGGG